MQEKLQKRLGALLRRQVRPPRPDLQQPNSGPRLLKKIVLGSAIFLVVFAVAGFFVVPPVAKHYLVKGLGEALGRPVAIEAIKLNPFTMIAVVKGVTVKERDASAAFVSFGELRLDVQTKSLFRLAPVLREIVLTDPYVHLVRDADGRTYNFSDQIEKFSRSSPPPGEPKGQVRFSLNNVQIVNGKIEIDDRPKQPRGFLAEMSASAQMIPAPVVFAACEIR